MSKEDMNSNEQPPQEGAGEVGTPERIEIVERYHIPDSYHDVSESVEEIVRHIMFHKALALNDSRKADRLDRYIELIKEYEEERVLYEHDPYERAISIAFELIIEEKMDPWEIDLVTFAEHYVKRMQSEQLVDLPSVGRVIHLAWSLLKMKSDRLLLLVSAMDKEEEDDYFDPLEDFMFEEEDDAMFREALLNTSEPPVSVLVTRKTSRPVTLMELIDALEEANREAERNLERAKTREAMRARQRERARNLVDRELHQEAIEKEKELLLKRIEANFADREVPISMLLPENPSYMDLIRVFIAALHLRKDGYVLLRQDTIPDGVVYVRLNTGE